MVRANAVVVLVYSLEGLGGGGGVREGRAMMKTYISSTLHNKCSVSELFN